MNAAKSGIVAEFVTAYLQREIPIKAIVTGGTDAGLRDALVTGYAPGRLVKIVNSNGVNTIVAPTGVTSKSIGDATHIIAQSDDTVKDMPQDFNYQERYNNLPNLICKNSTEEKTVAVYKIVNVDDIKLVKIAEPVAMKTAVNATGTFTVGPATYQFIQTGINTFKVIGTIPHIAQNGAIVTGNKAFAGNFMYLKMVNAEIATSAAYNAATTGVETSAIVYKRISPIFPVNEVTKSDIASEINTNGGIEIEVCIKRGDDVAKEIKFEVMWSTGNFTTYTFDLSEVQFEEASV